jgi:hypothetical protein
MVLCALDMRLRPAPSSALGLPRALVALALLVVPAASHAQEKPPTIRLQLPGSGAFDSEQTVPVAEAVLIPTLSAFIGRASVGRQSAGLFGAYVILSSQALGCGRVQWPPPAIDEGNTPRTEELRKRLAATRPKPREAAAAFAPTSDADWEIWAFALEPFDPREMEANPEARPSVGYAILHGRFGETTYTPRDFQTFALHGRLGYQSAAAKPLPPRHPARFEVERLDSGPRLHLSLEEPELVVRAEGIPLLHCPPVEHIHIEPRR